MSKLNIEPMNTLAPVKALGNQGFFVGITMGSLVVSWENKVYMFDRDSEITPSSLKQRCNELFGIFCDPKYTEEFSEFSKGLKDIQDESIFQMILTFESSVYPVLFVPNSDIPDLVSNKEVLH
jgi:hypothetical protein